MTRCVRTGLAVFLVALAAVSPAAMAARGTLTVPCVTGRSEARPFVGHPGWVEVFTKGYGVSTSARIDDHATFELPDPTKPVCLIASLDKFETPPIILGRWPTAPGDYDVPIPVEYACLPVGFPGEWDPKQKVEGRDLFQAFVPRCTQLYGVLFFGEARVADWGNEVHVMLHKGVPTDQPIPMKDQVSPDPGWEGKIDRVSTNQSREPWLRMGWRHGNMPVEPGQTYVLEVEGYRSHSGKHHETGAFIRPDKGDGYPDGHASVGEQKTEGDLCCLIFGNAHGQLVENHIRCEEWEVFIPRHRPTVDWGQTFVSHGQSLAGITCWAAVEGDAEVKCEIRVREEGPWGKMLKPAKVARGLESPARPLIRYLDTPAPLPGYESWYKLPARLFQAAYIPDEMPLTPGKTYYVELVPTRPVMMYADGDFYQEGYAYYEGLKMDRAIAGGTTKHSKRWTLAMSIVTYANKNGTPESR
ncbi:MAG: hypothetical protein GX616_05465 [Planctomycetes bacterium]|nr:hypothetical protein [Planctomycetota bacterium]